jgi:ABC-type nitrate/sulfonate/bicarbonate transport system permease component
MTATRRATDTLIIFAVMLAVWQILNHVAGDTALPAPKATMVYLMHMVPTERFASNAAATLLAFGFALVLAYAIGLSVGVWMGAHRRRSRSIRWCC